MTLIIKNTLIFLFKLLVLLFVLSFERVVGLPFIFSLFGLIWLDQSQKFFYIRPVLLLIFSFLMAVMFQTAWLTTMVVWCLSLTFMVLGTKLVRVKKRRFLIVVIIQNLLWLWWLNIPVSLSLLFQLVISYVLVIVWLRIFSKPKQT